MTGSVQLRERNMHSYVHDDQISNLAVLLGNNDSLFEGKNL